MSQPYGYQPMPSPAAWQPAPAQPSRPRTVNIAIGFGIVFAAFYLFLAWKVYAGKSWARITTWVFCGLAILGTLLEFAQANTGTVKALGVVEGLIAVAIVVLLAVRPSNEYFRKARPIYAYGFDPPI